MAERLLRGIRVVLRNDASAYGYSLLATASFGVLIAQEGAATTGQIFAFVVGAAGSFGAFEALATDLFRQRIRLERSEVVLLASAFNLVSTVASLGMVTLVGVVLDGWAPWFLGPFAGTAVYFVLTGATVAGAAEAEQRNPPTESR